MKIKVRMRQRCPECEGDALFYQHNIDENGGCISSTFWCESCRLYFSIFNEFIAQALTDDTIILPDEIIEDYAEANN